MADKTISALTSASTPLAGTEVLPIVQGGATVKVAVSDLTAGRAVSTGNVTLNSTDAGATAGPLLDLYRNSASPAVSDIIGECKFNGQDSAGNKQQYAVIHATIVSPTSTAEAGQIHFETATAGATTEKMIIGTSNLVINDIGAVFNVRIEGDGDANLFFTDATNSRIGVGTITPAQKLDVVGKIQVSDNLIISTSGKGIDFSATSGTGTSELLADYEEGTFTLTATAAVGTLTSFTSFGLYTKVGRTVTIMGAVKITDVGTGSAGLNLAGFPFTCYNTTTPADAGSYGIGREDAATGTLFAPKIFANSTTGFIALAPVTGYIFDFTLVYQAA
jgi:hypothetical protein